MSDTEIIPIVDLNDEIIGYKARTDMTQDDICRITGCWITDSQGNILLAQRALSKKNNPGKRGPAVAGTVNKGETYLQNIVKEIKEEIGLDVNPKDLITTTKRYSEYNKKMGQGFGFQYSGAKDTLIKQDSEVEELRRYTPEEIKDAIAKNTDMFTPGTIRAFNYFQSHA